jgi:VCBS repeat-containing protein/ELWxxDGT repeat protein
MANAKAVISGQATGVSVEDSPSAIGNVLSFVDPDPNQSHAKAIANAAAKYGTWSIDADGAWSYLLDNSNPAVQALGVGKTLADHFIVSSLDGSASKMIKITILGTNDVAVITGDTTGNVTEDKAYHAHGTLMVVDADQGQAHVKAVAHGVSDHGTWAIDTSGHWNYTITNGDPAVQALAAGETLTDHFTVTSLDGSASQIITITITGTNDVPVISGQATGNVVEDGTLTATGTLIIADKDHDQSHSQAASGTAKYGNWSVDADGHWSYQLDNSNTTVQALGAGKTLTDSFVVTSEDGTATKTVKVTITGSNDVATISGQSSGQVTENVALKATGTLTIADGDAGQAHSQAVAHGSAVYGSWSVDTNGHWTYNLDKTNAAVVALPTGQTLSDSFVITSQDGSASQTVSITIAGNSHNHVPVITGAVTGVTTEDSAVAVTGTVVVTDADVGQSHTKIVNAAATTYGSWSVDGDGHWNYQLANNKPQVQALADGQKVVDTFTITSQDGTATRTVSITITGTNDQPIATADSKSGDEDHLITGQLKATDVDQGDQLTYSLAVNGAPAHGGVVINADGSYTYTPNANYNGGDSFTYQVSDGHGGLSTATITLNVVAVNDAPTAPVDSNAAHNTVESGAAAGTPVGITVHATDIDSPSLTYSLTNDAGGRFQIDPQTGVISVANGAALDAGAYTVTAVASDGQAQSAPTDYSITVTNAGANHAPELAATPTFAFVAAAPEGWSVWISTTDGQPVNVGTFNAINAFPNFLTDVGGKLYFSVDDGQHGNELWAFDPQTGASNLVTDIWPGASAGNPEYLTVLDGKIYFSARNGIGSSELWVYDPLANSATLAESLPGSFTSGPQGLIAAGGKIYFTAFDNAHGGELWVYDPATRLSTLAAEVAPGAAGGNPQFLTELEGKIYFNAGDFWHSSLWVYDPATQSAQLADPIASASGTFPTNFMPLDGKLYYTFTSSATGTEVWVYDPATGKSTVATDVIPGSDGSSPYYLTVVDHKLYFVANEKDATSGQYSQRLWAYDPQTQTTTLENTLEVNGHGVQAAFLKEVGGKIYYSADDGVHGRELWVYDPATHQASLYADLQPGSSVLISDNSVELGGNLYFSGYGQAHASELWVYDSATNTTHAVPGVTPDVGTTPQFIAALDGKLYYSGTDATHGVQLWSYDPQAQVASLVSDVASGNLGTDPQYMAGLNGKLYFSSYDAAHGYELKSFDPATHAVTLISDLIPGSDGSSPKFLTALDGKLYFSATDGTHGEELWVCDTATQSVSLVQDIYSGPQGSAPHSLTAAGGNLYFLASNWQNANELWLYDPALHSSKIVAFPPAPGFPGMTQTLTAVGDGIALAMDFSLYGTEVWYYKASTNTFSSTGDVNPGTGGSNPHCLTEFDGKLYYSATHDGSNYALWVFDPATYTTTVALGAPFGNILSMTVVNGKLLISQQGSNGATVLSAYDPVAHTTATVTTVGGIPNHSDPQGIVSLHSDSVALLSIEENSTTNFGTSIATLLAGHVSDVDPNAKLGIALIGADTSHGQWQYSLDGGAHWLTLSVVSDHAATLLDGAARLRFVPDADWAGHADVEIRAWDQTDGHHTGDSGVDASQNGGTSAYSSSALHAVIQVTLPPPTENADIIHGTENADTLNSLGGDDHIYGHGGNDTINGGKGDDTLDGGAGADTFLFAVGDGHDTIVASGYDSADTIKLIGGTFYDLNFSFDGNDLLVAQAIDSNYNFNDTGYMRLHDFLTTGDHSITVKVDTGINNTFYGTDANLSTIVFHTGVNGDTNTNSSEVLIGTNGDDVINGNGGYYDALYGMGGNDIINGGDGVDWIRGGDGDDTLYGGKGNDRYDGGAGADTFLFNVGDGNDHINAGGYDSQDTIKLLGSNFYDINFTHNGQDLWVGQAIDGNYDWNQTGRVELRHFLDGSDGYITVQIDTGHDTNLFYGTDASHATFTFQQGLDGTDNADHAEIILGTNGDDVINGNGGYYDGLYGNGGNDIINGGYGTDHLIGGAGDDTLNGFGGDDLLRGDAGNDTLDGGTGINTADYRYAAGGIIADLSSGQTSDDGDGGHDTLSNIQNVTGSGHNDTITGDGAHNVLDGRGGDDILIGGGEGDVLIGGTGADQFKYNGASDSTLSHLDVISDFNAGDGDTINLSALGLSGGLTNGGTVGALGNAPGSGFGGNGLIVETDGVNTRIYADSDHNGTFNAATDLVVQLTGNHLNEIITHPTAIVT